jgi:hypothetical protein
MQYLSSRQRLTVISLVCNTEHLSKPCHCSCCGRQFSVRREEEFLRFYFNSYIATAHLSSQTVQLPEGRVGGKGDKSKSHASHTRPQQCYRRPVRKLTTAKLNRGYRFRMLGWPCPAIYTWKTKLVNMLAIMRT